MVTVTGDKLRELLADFVSAMLVTRTPAGELRSRPMAVADVESGGCLWFVTGRQSGKLGEIAHDDHVNVAMQSTRKFVSTSGRAVVVDDARKVAEVWNEAWRVWFPGGKDDPSLVLLKVHGDEEEYWDNRGTGGVKYLIAAGKAYLSGTKPREVEADPTVHGKVAM